MVRVLVLGATGYIGFPLCQSLRRDGHTVYGLARSAEKAQSLAKVEVTPVSGTVEGGEYLQVVTKANIDIVIDASTANQGSYAVLKALKGVSEQRVQKRGRHSPKLGFIYISGTWVHGSSPSPVSDLSPVSVENDDGCHTQPPTLVAWRPALEQSILDACDVLDAIILRPSLLYGGPSTLWSLWFGPLTKAVATSTNEVQLLADATAELGLIHVDDVVSAIHLAVAKFGSVSTASGNYPVFDIVSSSEPVKHILDAAARVLGFRGQITYGEAQADNKFAVAMSTTMRSTSTRLRDLLGWVPKHTSIGGEIETFVAAWKAHE